MYNQEMEFEWDEGPRIRRTSVSTASGSRRPFFEGTVEKAPDRRRDYGEERHISIGRVGPGALIVVAYTERCGRIRLISACPASRKERKVYHEQTLR